jgi:osmoprotectant transport system ATP-binding protein
MQDTGLFPHYTIEENIAIVPRLLGWPKEKTRERSEELMEKFHLPPARFMKLYPHQLSGGEQQRVGFIRAMMADPPVMLMDEPLGALDPVTRARIRREFNALEELRSKTIVLVTHDIEEAFELGDRICLMSRGKILQTGRPEELLLNPADDFVRMFFDGQRFQLELKTVRLADLWDLLPDIPAQENTATVLDSENSLLEALEQAIAGQVMIRNKYTGETKVTEMDKIMQAFRLRRNIECKM